MTALPARSTLDGSATPTTSAMKTALGALRDYLNEQLGAVGGAPVVPSLNGGQLAGLRNRIINGNFGINQRAYVSGAAVGANLYGHDRWKMAASADTYTYSTTANVTTVTIPASKILQQVIEGLNLESGTYTLSWSGTAQGKIGAGSYGASGITGVIVGGTNTTIEFGPGTVSKVQLEFGSTATPFEQRPYGMELALCQRYCLRYGTGFSGAPYIASGLFTTTSTAVIIFNLPVPLRATPTLTYAGVFSNYGLTSQAVNTIPTSITLSGSSANIISITVVGTGAPYTPASVALFSSDATGAGGLILSSEL